MDIEIDITKQDEFIFDGYLYYGLYEAGMEFKEVTYYTLHREPVDGGDPEKVTSLPPHIENYLTDHALGILEAQHDSDLEQAGDLEQADDLFTGNTMDIGINITKHDEFIVDGYLYYGFYEVDMEFKEITIYTLHREPEEGGDPETVTSLPPHLENYLTDHAQDIFEAQHESDLEQADDLRLL